MYCVQIGSEWIGLMSTVYEIEDALRVRGIKESIVKTVVVHCWMVYGSAEPQVAHRGNGIFVDWEP